MIRVLFVCSGPGVRSRIAEAFLNLHDGFEANSAQFENRQGPVPPFIEALMEEIQVELSSNFPTSVFDLHRQQERYDFVITLCQASTTVVCPVFRGNIDVMYGKKAERLSWTIDDFRSVSNLSGEERWEKARVIRDQIKQEVASFAQSVRDGISKLPT